MAQLLDAVFPHADTVPVFVSLNELPDGEVLTASICVIGGGAAGISIAMEFIGSGIDVTVLESGGFEYDDDIHQLTTGENVGLHYYDLDTARLRYFGGSTNHWAGQSCPLEHNDFLPRHWVADSGWPITYAAFAEYLPRAERLCKLTQPPPDGSFWGLREEMPAFPLEEGGFVPVVFRYPEPVFSFGVDYRRILDRAEEIRCLLHANVLRINSDAAGNRVTHLDLATLGGKRLRMEARTVILAAGGIENCRLLLLSGPEGGDRPGPGLGNMHDMVGRFFMEHPNYDTGLVQLTSESRYLADALTSFGSESVRLDFRLSPEQQAQKEILNHSAFLRRVREQDMLDRAWNRISKAVFGSYELLLRLRVRLEHAPSPDSRVTLADQIDVFGQPRARLSLRMGELETRTVQAVSESFARALGLAEQGRMRIEFDPADTGWMSEVGWQYHHCGGTRMHADPRKGVVDANCRVHGLANLYVAGSSIFPTSGHANPTVNLLAFALRLADHLKQELAD